jgi:hypothetical protein
VRALASLALALVFAAGADEVFVMSTGPSLEERIGSLELIAGRLL